MLHLYISKLVGRCTISLFPYICQWRSTWNKFSYSNELPNYEKVYRPEN